MYIGMCAGHCRRKMVISQALATQLCVHIRTYSICLFAYVRICVHIEQYCIKHLFTVDIQYHCGMDLNYVHTYIHMYVCT